MSRTVEVDEDILINACWDRIDNFKQAKSFGDDFWEEVFNYLSDIGWLKPRYNDPSYIVDNIVYNGDIKHIEDDADELREYNSEIDSEYDGNVIEWARDEGYEIFGDYIVINLGL